MVGEGIFYRLIQKDGMDVTVKIRKEIEDEDTGHVDYDYPETITVRAIIVSASGMTETWGVVGVYEGMDYVACVMPLTDKKANLYFSPIDLGDLVLLDEVDYECVEVIPRRISDKVLYYECLLRKRE